MRNYNKNQLAFIAESLALDSSADINEIIAGATAYLISPETNDVVTEYIQSLYNDLNPEATQLTEDGLYGRMTGAALREMMIKSGHIKTAANMDPDTIESTIVKLLPLWSSSAHDKIIEMFYSFLSVAGKDLESLKLSREDQWAVFVGQIREETGPKFRTKENLNYSCNALVKLFSAYRKNKCGKNLHLKHGRCNGHRADQAAIANVAYANRIGNGDYNSGDGALFLGGGLKQLTGRGNYEGYHNWLKTNYPDIYASTNGEEILTKGAEVVSKGIHAILSAVYFWNEHGVYKAADAAGSVKDKAYAATKIVNRHTDSYESRYAHTKKAYGLLGIA